MRTAIILIAVESAVLLLLALLLDSFLGLQHVVKKHIELFKSCKFQYLIFYGLPLPLALSLALLTEAGEGTYALMTIFAGILFITQPIILGALSRLSFSSVRSVEIREKVRVVMDETVTVTEFCSIVSLLLAAGGIAGVILCDASTFYFGATLGGHLLFCAVCYLAIVLFLNLLVVMKRFGRMVEVSIDGDQVS